MPDSSTTAPGTTGAPGPSGPSGPAPMTEEQLAAYIQQGVPTAATGEGDWIGVGAGYTPTDPVYGKPLPGLQARYKEGEEYLLGAQGAAEIMKWKRALVLAGYLPRTALASEIWDGEAIKAYKAVLGLANAYGIDRSAMMQKLLDDPGVTKMSEAGQREALVLQVTDPEDIRAIALRVGRRVLGRNPDEATLGRIVSGYQQAQTAPQQAAYAASGPDGAGGTVTAAPGVDVYAEDVIRSTNPSEAVAHDLATGVFDAFEGMLNGIGGA